MSDRVETSTDALEANGQSGAPPTPTPTPNPPRRRRLLRRGVSALLIVIVVWLISAYVILPALWKHYEHHPALEDAPKTTLTSQGIPGDPLNVGLIGTTHELIQAMLEAGWHPADPVTLKSSLGIAGSVLLRRPYVAAPVSNLFVFGRRQDLAFEKPVGKSASRRHHVRFWRSSELGEGGEPLWIGAVTFDRSVGLSHRTGQVTHHIAADVDSERDGLFADLVTARQLGKLFQVTGVGSTLAGRNGGGDRYFTDGELTVGILARDGEPERLPNPPVVRFKDQFWSTIRPLLQSVSDPGS
jgi:hypothetical protein